ncbi:hypothetical protein IWX90DRAFT_6243 [Phyllosticta citrichinensis]|uniref:Uncharacterized protein n=1 Tax=Phyllosticta citrichinensis TaxID=1130410 RepID=A0ABR1Y590_9PEZI
MDKLGSTMPACLPACSLCACASQVPGLAAGHPITNKQASNQRAACAHAPMRALAALVSLRKSKRAKFLAESRQAADMVWRRASASRPLGARGPRDETRDGRETETACVWVGGLCMERGCGCSGSCSFLFVSFSANVTTKILPYTQTMDIMWPLQYHDRPSTYEARASSGCRGLAVGRHCRGP